MFFGVRDESVRFTGRWNVNETVATTTAPGSMFEIAYLGKDIVLHFDLATNVHPYPHLWIIVDDLVKVETAIDHVIRIENPTVGKHVVRVIFKGAVEIQHRWYAPLIGKVTFTGYDADMRADLPEDNRKIIEFIGDSITEGVLIDPFYKYEAKEQFNRPYQDDSTATYAYLTAMALNMKPIIVGYGAVGTTKSGQGSVPKASESYPYNYAGSLASPSGADIIVINHGANDRRATAENYIAGYRDLLDEVVKLNETAQIVVLSSFSKIHVSQLKSFVIDYNHEHQMKIKFIDSSDWIPVEPLHPLREGHRIISEHLVEELKKLGLADHKTFSIKKS